MVSNMKLERVKREITQVDLWERTGIPQWRISLIERGLIPTEDEAERIASVLEKESHELFPAVNQAHSESRASSNCVR